MAGRGRTVRTIRLARAEAPDRPGLLVIAAGANAQHYVFREIPCEIGGRGFALHRLGLGELYHVRIGAPADTSCECLGFLRHGRCKHVDGLKALISRLPGRRQPDRLPADSP